jgi:D-alanyl-D-alanine carboxypeptidase
LACVAFGVGADPAPASAKAPRVAPSPAATPLLSARRVPALFVDAVALTRLRSLVTAVVAPVDACVAVDDRSTPLVRIDPERPLAGASTQKILVAAAALSVLGDDYHFATNVVSKGTIEGGVLTGDLVVVGGGDPVLTTAPDPGPATTPLSGLADAIVGAGITRIDGELIAADGNNSAHVDSPPLSAIVEEMLSASNNETAELLTRELGFEAAGMGTTATGTQAVKAALVRLGVPLAGVDLHDGSGLAPSNRVTCAALLRVVALSARAKLTAIDRGLAIAGQTGTLAPRFVGTSLAGRLRAKTGHIDGVVGLTGLIDAPSGSEIAPRFAFVANGTFSTAEGEQLQEQIAAVIGAYQDTPPSAELVPAPVASE